MCTSLCTPGIVLSCLQARISLFQDIFYSYEIGHIYDNISYDNPIDIVKCDGDDGCHKLF